MEISTPLFMGSLIRLTRIDLDNDPAVMSRWSHIPAYTRMFGAELSRPVSAFEVKKQLEGIEKSADEDKSTFYFHIRLPGEERLLGFAKIDWILWNARSGRISLGIGDPQDWNKGYGSDAMRLMLRFAFGELNLNRLFAFTPEYNLAGIHLLEKFGFTQDIRRREALMRDGRRWDQLAFGLLNREWQGSLQQKG